MSPRWTPLILITLLSLVLAGCGTFDNLTGAGDEAEASAAPVAEAETATEPTPAPTATAAPTEPPAPTEAPAEATGSPEPATEAPPAATENSEAAASSTETKSYQIVPEESQAGYAVEEEFFGRDIPFFTAMGSTSNIEGEFQVTYTGNQVALEGGQFVVDLRTLTSDDPRRDNRIRTDWLESNNFPLAEFTASTLEEFPATAAEGQDVSFKVSGDMTIRQVTNQQTFDITARLENDTFTGTGTTFLFMKDYGFDPPSIAGILKVTDGVTITVTFTAIETAEGS